MDAGGHMANHRRVELRIRNLDDETHHLLKIKAVTEKKTLNEIMLEALRAYVAPSTTKRPK
jgi:plasmid stability protein